ncbi:hypothetical protein GGR56DRAFT_672187 [Xylariaceae sp. FL0804]|nr:hypothetical protein GGR56DRAFT_672187 [Xylariaceae sp. FL0804]
MASSLPSQLAEAVQTAHIKRDPSPTHDLNPSTAASARQPVSTTSNLIFDDDDGIDDVDSEEGGNEVDDDDDDIPVSVLRPHARRHNFPPMPDMRFEQSYLHSIAKAESWQRVAWITMRDQILMPFAQGVAYNLVLCGWQHWNRNAQMSGSSYGARARRWWYAVNHWPLPEHTRVD